MEVNFQETDPKSLNQLLSKQYPSAATVNFEDVELTEDEVTLALLEARVKKLEVLEYQRKENNRKERETEALRKWSAQELYQQAQMKAFMIEPNFNMDNDVTTVMQNLALYFTEHPQFEKRGYDLKKGILLCGNVGVGKTTLMKVFSRNKRQCFDIVSARRISDEYMEDGSEMMHRYYSPFPSLIGTYEFFLQKSIGICIDDIGTEQCPAKHYGSDLNTIEKIILNRYDRRVPPHFTHFTTNLTSDQLLAFYGTRAISRLRETVNMIEMGGSDRRK